ncbi:hypothetical protein V1517DRAFT_276332 [Lipomyces orientalis]|uniref:Uncharacterized protein n=1 Tax=Lipomyces orientalis TaxID=1233043 RepID=A0ACC3TN22_9ASCO
MDSSSNPQHGRACDQCWSRKVKCGRSQPCPRCSNLSLNCSYIRPRRKKGPPGKRIGLIQLRSSTATADAVNATRTPITESIDEESPLALTLSPSPLCCLSPSGTDAPSIAVGMTANEMLVRSDLLHSLFTDFSADSGPLVINEDHYLAPVNVDSSTMDSLVRTYTWRMSKYYPLVDTASLLERLRARENTKNVEFGALVFSICAFVLVQPVFKRDVLQDKTTLHERSHLAQTLMDDAIAMRNMDPSFMERPSIDSILTSFFLFACLLNRQLPHAAWLRLREAVTMAEIMEMQSLENVTITVEEREKRATLYRILAVTEHAYAVQRRYALSRNLLSRLQRSAFSAVYPNCLSATYGVTKLVSLFSVISVDILDCWNEKCAASSPGDGCTRFTTERALEMHRLISEVYDDKPKSDSLLSEPQIADIMISQQWLHNRLWNVCHTHGLLNEEGTAESCREMSITYAIDIARDTIQISKKFTMENLEVHGIGIIGKLYDIATSAVMLISCYQSLRKWRIENCNVVPSDMEMLNQFVALLATFGGGQHPYLVPLMVAIAGVPPL